MFKKTLLSSCILAAALASSAAMAESFPPAPAPEGTHLGGVILNPYGHTPLVAVINRDGKDAENIHVTVHGWGAKGVDISYDVGRSTFLTHDGVPVFGLYPNHTNRVTVTYTQNGKKIKDEYRIITGAVTNSYSDSRNITALPSPKVVKVDPKFKDRLYFVNSGTRPPMGSDINWVMPKPKSASKTAANPSGGSVPFQTVPLNYIVDTQGEFRWWWNPDVVYDGRGIDVAKRGYAMGFHPTKSGTYTFVQGQRWYEMNFMGKIVGEHDLPRGYIDMSHASWEMPNGHILLRAAKANYLRPDGQKVHTVRDHILEVDRSGNLIDVWDLNKILDNTRDDLIKNLDLGAVCMNVDVTAAGQKVANEPEAPFGDAPGVGAGRNWAHVNSVAYDPSDDSIIISARHQGVVKIGRDKEVKWILAPHTGWKNGLEKKLLTPVDKNGKPIKCTPMGECEGNFDFTYTQHAAWPSASGRGNLTVFDNGQIRHYEQPPLPDMNYSRIVEYKIDPVKMTVQQTWEFGKEKGVDWFAAITSNVQWQKDRDTMFAFWGSVGIFNPKTGTIGRISEQDYKTKGIKVQIDVHNDKPASTHYQAHVFDPEKVFAR